MLPVVYRAWGGSLWLATGLVVPLLGVLAAAVAPVTGGVLGGAVPLAFFVLGAWTVWVDRQQLAQTLPMPVAPELVAGVLVVVGVSSAWQAGAWIDLVVVAVALGLGVALASSGSWRQSWQRAARWYTLRHPPPVRIEPLSRPGNRPDLD